MILGLRDARTGGEARRDRSRTTVRTSLHFRQIDCLTPDAKKSRCGLIRKVRRKHGEVLPPEPKPLELLIHTDKTLDKRRLEQLLLQ